MRYLKYFAIAGVLLLAGYAFGQGRGGGAGRYRAVVLTNLSEGPGKTKLRFRELPYVTEALNNLAADGFHPIMVSSVSNPAGHGRAIVICHKR